MNPQSLARAEVLAMSPYESARSGAAADGVLLNANEAPSVLGTNPELKRLELNRYPPPQPAELRDQLATLYGVDPDQLLITRGSDEGIDLLLRVFCRSGEDQILECPPCFGMYRIAAQIQGAGVISVPRDEASLKLREPELLEAIARSDRLKLVFLTSPNNPTGDRMDEASLERVLKATDGRALVVMDEAYIEFCAARSATTLLSRYRHLVILRTLSKAWGAAGLRCGSVLADPAVIELLGRVMAPYPLTAQAIDTALAITAPGSGPAQETMLRDLAGEKQRLVRDLSTRSWAIQTWDGEANFVLVRVDDGPALVAHCAAQGVRIRDFSQQALLSNCVRFTIGSPEDMSALRDALDRYGAPL